MQTPTPVNRTNGTSHITLEAQIGLWLCQQRDAIQFCKDILFIAARWDDLIDRDVVLSDADIHTFVETIFSLQLNPFYLAHFAAFYTLIHNSIRNWKAATAVERDETSSELALMQAFVFRSSYRDILAHAASLVSDNAHAERVVREIRTSPLWNEDFETYKRELIREKDRRHAMRD